MMHGKSAVFIDAVSETSHHGFPMCQLFWSAFMPMGLQSQVFIRTRPQGRAVLQVSAACGQRLVASPRSLPGLLRRYLFLEFFCALLAGDDLFPGHFALKECQVFSRKLFGGTG